MLGWRGSHMATSNDPTFVVSKNIYIFKTYARKKIFGKKKKYQSSEGMKLRHG